jgi:hypothetical protein
MILKMAQVNSDKFSIFALVVIYPGAPLITDTLLNPISS